MAYYCYFYNFLYRVDLYPNLSVQNKLRTCYKGTCALKIVIRLRRVILRCCKSYVEQETLPKICEKLLLRYAPV